MTLRWWYTMKFIIIDKSLAKNKKSFICFRWPWGPERRDPGGWWRGDLCGRGRPGLHRIHDRWSFRRRKVFLFVSSSSPRYAHKHEVLTSVLGKKIPVGGIPGLDLSDPKQLADFARWVVVVVVIVVVVGADFARWVVVVVVVVADFARWVKSQFSCIW